MANGGRAALIVPVVMVLFTWSLTTHGKYSASGDEPHYLMIAESLVSDHDLDVANNYANDDGRLFGHDHLGIGLHAARSRSGRMLPIHDIGLAVALVPVYAVARAVAGVTPPGVLKRFRMDRGLFAYSIVGLFLIALTAAGFTLLAIAFASAQDPGRVAALLVAAGISPPIVSHAFLVFPEVLALFVTCAVVWLANKREGPRDTAALLVLLLALGALPWTHHKYLLYVPGLVFVLLVARWPLVRSWSAGTAAAALALLLLPQVGLEAWTWHSWGTLGGALTTQGVPFSVESLKRGLVGLWIDRQSGLLAYAPLYWIVPACWWLTWRRTWMYAVPFVLLYVPAAAFVIGWWAGFSPAARYITPAVPLLLVPMVTALSSRSIRVAAAVLLVPQLIIDAVVWQHPRWLWPAPAGNLALRALGPLGRAYERVLVSAQGGSVGAAAVWVALGVAAATIALVTGARADVPRAAQGSASGS
ncbi:MAG: hypothetical protein ACM3SQ_16525 [Betaproteobacteria bacterium]